MTNQLLQSPGIHWYPSKVDWWLAPILALPPIASIVVCILLAMSKPSELPIGIVAAFFVAALYIGLVIPIGYGIDVDNGTLIVRFGMVRKRIPLSAIREVHPTRNPLSAPALSLDRLHVKFGDGLFNAVMISPTNRDMFLDDLALHTGLIREGDSLLPKRN
jgi:Protein of unknown function (DUF1200).